MRNILIIVILTIITLNACKDINDIHQIYLDRGEKVYLARPDSIIAEQGYKKIRLKWLVNPSPNIKSTVIYWNDRKDSIEHILNRTGGHQKDSVTITGLEEKVHVFELINRGDNNDRSLPGGEIIVNVLGDIYKNALLPCQYSYSFNNNEDTVTLKWGNTDKTYQYSIVKYSAKSDGTSKELKCSYSDKTTVIGGVNSSVGKSMTVSSFYKPDSNAFEEFESSVDKIIFGIMLHEGIYISSGYFEHPTSPRDLASEKYLTKVNETTLTGAHSDLGDSGYTIRITVNADYSVIVEQFNPEPLGEMVPGAVNKYDPVTKTFTLNYRYMAGTGWIIIHETLKLK